MELFGNFRKKTLYFAGIYAIFHGLVARDRIRVKKTPDPHH